MTWRGPRSALARGLVALTAAATGFVGVSVGRAQPAAGLARAKDLYLSAEAAMRDGRFDDAIRDYGAAYELSRDPALLYKLGRAHERAGRCQTAVTYFARYLRDGKPGAQFVALTRERIAACGGDPASVEAPSSPSGPAGAAVAAPGAGGRNAAGAPGAGAPDGAAAREAMRAGARPDATPPREATAQPGAATPREATAQPGAATPREATAQPGAATPREATTQPASANGLSTAAGPGEPPAPPGPALRLVPSTPHKIAWLLGGSTIALAALGGVLAYATNSAENDVRDLYVGFAGRTPAYDAATQTRYHELIDEGRRYERLSWTAFGLAGATAIGAAVLFAIGRDEAPEPARVVPVVSSRGAGVAVRF